MCLWCPFPRVLRAEGERCTGQEVSLYSLPCSEGSHIRGQAMPAHRNRGARSFAAMWVCAVQLCTDYSQLLVAHLYLCHHVNHLPCSLSNVFCCC